jgi:hypothetical protein
MKTPTPEEVAAAMLYGKGGWLYDDLKPLFGQDTKHYTHIPDKACAVLAAEVDKLRAERDLLLAREKMIISFCETEMAWMYFRAEFELSSNPTTTEQNAHKLRDFLKNHGGMPNQNNK